MVSGSVMACSRLAGGMDELRRGQPPRTARPFSPALASTPALAGLWPGTCPGRVRGARPESGRGAAVQGCRRWYAVLPFTVPVAGLPVLPKLRRRRAYRRGCGQRLRVWVPIRRYVRRRAQLRSKLKVNIALYTEPGCAEAQISQAESTFVRVFGIEFRQQPGARTAWVKPFDHGRVVSPPSGPICKQLRALCFGEQFHGMVLSNIGHRDAPALRPSAPGQKPAPVCCGTRQAVCDGGMPPAISRPAAVRGSQNPE